MMSSRILKHRKDYNTPKEYSDNCPRHVVRISAGPNDIEGWGYYITIKWPEVLNWLMSNCKFRVYFGNWPPIEIENFTAAALRKGFSYKRETVIFELMPYGNGLPPDIMEFENKEDCALFMLHFPEMVDWARGSDS